MSTEVRNTSTIGDFSPTTKPPISLVAIHKLYQKVSPHALANDANVIDFHRISEHAQNARLVLIRELGSGHLAEAFASFEDPNSKIGGPEIINIKIYEHPDLPGLQFLPFLLPKRTQETFASRLLHRDLSTPTHKTNVHFHHAIPYHDLLSASDGSSSHGSPRSSFFHSRPDCPLTFPPIDPDVHKPLTLYQFLNRKLRWMTLGGQYDWTKKAYPEGDYPDFPADIAKLIRSLFPDIRPEAAIVNFYSPGDTLSVHRDVSETSDAGLVSISLGCDGLFIAGLEDQSTGQIKHIVVRLRSGDAVLMSGSSRFAWHSVPQVIANTCPPWLSDWPASTIHLAEETTPSDPFEAWRGWMANKRINVNIRQMRD